MAAVQPHNGDASLAALAPRARSRGAASSTASVASSDNLADGYSDASSTQRRRMSMSRIFRGRKHDKTTNDKDRNKDKNKDNDNDNDNDDDMHHGPPLPVLRHPSTEPLNRSDESLGLYRSTPSSLLTDSDTEA